VLSPFSLGRGEAGPSPRSTFVSIGKRGKT
jgi:hypothetical protein